MGMYIYTSNAFAIYILTFFTDMSGGENNNTKLKKRKKI